MTVRTRWLIALVIAPVLWGVACHDTDAPTATPIPPEVQALKSSLAPYSSLALAKIATGKPADARPLLERAVTIADKAKLPAKYLAPTRDALAKLP